MEANVSNSQSHEKRVARETQELGLYLAEITAFERAELNELRAQLIRMYFVENPRPFGKVEIMEMATRLKLSPADLQQWALRKLGVYIEEDLPSRGKHRGDAYINRVVLEDFLRTKEVPLDRTVTQRKIGNLAKKLGVPKLQIQRLAFETFVSMIHKSVF
jgi:hypothetical protein